MPGIRSPTPIPHSILSRTLLKQETFAEISCVSRRNLQRKAGLTIDIGMVAIVGYFDHDLAFPGM